MRVYSILLLCLAILSVVHAYVTQVPAKDTKCFFEDLDRGERLVASYEVIAGGNNDINIRVTGPDNRLIFEELRKDEGSFQFVAVKRGLFQICFENSMSHLTGKTVSFNIYAGGDLHRYQNAKSSHMQPLDKAVMSLTESVRQFVDTYHYIRGRILTCHKTATSTNSRVFYWGFINLGLLLVSLYVKTALTKRPFDKRTVGYQPVRQY